MAFSNLGFEDPNSAAPGLPADWSVFDNSTAEEAADYDDGDTSSVLNRPVEAFEGAWDSNEDFVFAYVQPDDPAELEAGIYDDALPDSEDHEDFEEGWSSNEDFLTQMGSAEAASYDGTAEPVEDLEEGWSSNEDFLFAWDAGSEDAASYDPVTGPEDHEDFEEEWDDNHNFHTDIGAPTAAVYDDGAEPVEDFEETSERQLVTVDPSTDKIERAGHGLSDGEKVTFENEDGRLPEGLSARAIYFVVNATTDDFKVSATSGGSAVDITDAGLGSHFVLRDPSKFWIDFMETL